MMHWIHDPPCEVWWSARKSWKIFSAVLSWAVFVLAHTYSLCLENQDSWLHQHARHPHDERPLLQPQLETHTPRCWWNSREHTESVPSIAYLCLISARLESQGKHHDEQDVTEIQIASWGQKSKWTRPANSAKGVVCKPACGTMVSGNLSTFWFYKSDFNKVVVMIFYGSSP